MPKVNVWHTHCAYITRNNKDAIPRYTTFITANPKQPHVSAAENLKINLCEGEISDIDFILIYTGKFVSPSGICDPCGTVAGMVTPKGSMSTEGEILQVSVLRYRSSKFPLLVTRQMSNLAILVNSNTQNDFLFPVHAMFRHDCPIAVKPASTSRRLA